jgi:hypothetical protein
MDKKMIELDDGDELSPVDLTSHDVRVIIMDNGIKRVDLSIQPGDAVIIENVPGTGVKYGNRSSYNVILQRWDLNSLCILDFPIFVCLMPHTTQISDFFRSAPQ